LNLNCASLRLCFQQPSLVEKFLGALWILHAVLD
jgi:hypothetical protein